MGDLDDPVNTFWQLVTRPEGSTSWRLATPPGVASNGGLVASITPDLLTAGFEPSQALVFSPLLRSADDGANWTQSSLPGGGLLPAGLAAVPDALAGSSTVGYLALVRTSGGEVLSGTGGSARWTEATDVDRLAATPQSSACGVAGISAVAFAPDGGQLVGATCSRGNRVGIFERAGGGWRLAGPALAGGGSGPTQVVRLFGTGAQVTALVSLGPPGQRKLVAVSSSDGMKSWKVSSSLPIAGGQLTATGVTESGGPVVLFGSGKSERSAWVSVGTGQWQQLATPPAGTSAIVAGPNGSFEALIADRSTLVVETLAAGSWHRVQSLEVTIQYGSSS